MKKTCFLFCSILFFSCKKGNEFSSLKKEVVGRWEIEKVSGYEPPGTRTFSPGNGQIILKKDGGFERWKHDTLVFKGYYLVQRKKDCGPRDNDIILLTNENPSDSYNYVIIENGELILSTPNCWADGGIVYYRKVE